MNKQIPLRPIQQNRQLQRLLAEKRKLSLQKEALTALCLILTAALGLLLILI
ncbi:MAG: hypothetical protein IKD31_03265 [Clostridia bacterium]|nr:hypothetical protein [Clostridia bacterium]